MSEKKVKKIGTRDEVWNNKAMSTKGLLKKEDLIWDEKSNKYKSIKSIAHGKSLIELMKKRRSEAKIDDKIETPLIEPAEKN